MTKTMLSAPQACPSVGSILRRIALPLLIFAAVLFGFLSISYSLLLPQLTRVEVAGKQRDAIQLKSYVVQLEASVLQMEGQRRQLITPLREGLYGSLKEQKFATPDFLLLRSQVFEVASELVSERDDVVEIQIIHYLPEERVLEVSGGIYNVGPRSMTVLAQFVDELKRLPIVDSVHPPRFTRKHDDEKGYYSPFTFQLFLQ